MDNSDELSDLSEFSGTSPSIKLNENSSEEEQVDSIYFSEKSLMAQTGKMMRLEEPRTSETNGSSGTHNVQKKESQPRKEKKNSAMVRKGSLQ